VREKFEGTAKVIVFDGEGPRPIPFDCDCQELSRYLDCKWNWSLRRQM